MRYEAMESVLTKVAVEVNAGGEEFLESEGSDSNEGKRPSITDPHLRPRDRP